MSLFNAKKPRWTIVGASDLNCKAISIASQPGCDLRASSNNNRAFLRLFKYDFGPSGRVSYGFRELVFDVLEVPTFPQRKSTTRRPSLGWTLEIRNLETLRCDLGRIRFVGGGWRGGRMVHRTCTREASVALERHIIKCFLVNLLWDDMISTGPGRVLPCEDWIVRACTSLMFLATNFKGSFIPPSNSTS